MNKVIAWRILCQFLLGKVLPSTGILLMLAYRQMCQFLLGKVLQLYLSVFSSLYLIYFLYSTLFSFKKSVDLFSLFSFKTVFFLAF